jgi:hypothetical protein
MVLAARLESAIRNQSIERTQREMKQVSRQVEVKPRRAGPPRLQAREVGNGNDDAPTWPKNAVNFVERLARIRQVLEHMPQDDLVEMRIGILGVPQIICDTNLRSPIGTGRSSRANLESVGFETPVCQRRQQYAASASDIQHPRSANEAARQ